MTSEGMDGFEPIPRSRAGKTIVVVVGIAALVLTTLGFLTLFAYACTSDSTRFLP